MTQHPFHIFECLRALNSIVFSPVRDFSVYDNLLYLGNISFEKYAKFFPKNNWPYWLEVKRPDFDSFPVMPAEIADWIGNWGGQTPEYPPKVRKYYRNSNELWQDKQVDLSVPPAAGLSGERFDEQPERVQLWTKWLKKEWLPWAQDNLERFSAIETYEQFYHIFNKLDRNEEQFEFIASNAVLYWRFDSMEIRHPLITQRMELEYLPEQGIFNIVAKSSLPRLEYDMLYDLTGIDLQKIFMLEQKIFEQPVDLRDLEFLEDFCTEFAQIIGYDCTVSGEKITQATSVTSQPCIYYNEPVLFLRRQDGRKWRGELEGVVEAIDTGTSLPEVFSPYYMNTQGGEDVSGRNWKDNLTEPFFPWEEEPVHKDILRRVASNPLTVVQAPPKSSKEKLIANMLVHLLAHGKRVLITGNSSRSLREIGDLLYKEFPEISSLCVSATGTDRENTRELLSSLRAHSQKTSYHNKDEVARELAELQKRLGLFQKDLVEDRIQVQSAREFEYSRHFNIEGKENSPWQVARWLDINKERLGYISDDIGYDKECPLNKNEMNRFFELLEKVSLADGGRLSLWLPRQSELMNAKDLSDLLEALAELSLHKEERKELLSDCMVLEDIGSQQIREILLEYQQGLADLPGIEGDWLEAALRDAVSTLQKLKLWQDLYHSVNTSLQKIQTLLFTLSDHTVDLPEDVNYRQLREALYKLRVEFHKNNKLSILFKISAGKKVLKVYEECLLDGASAQNIKDIDLILAKIDYLDELKKVSLRWNNSVAEVGGPAVEVYEPGFTETLARYSGQIKRVLDWRSKHLKNLNSCWEKFARREPAQWTNRNWFIGMLPRVQAWMADKREEELTELLAGQYEAVLKSPQEKELSPVCYKFKEALDKKDIELWQKCQKDLVEIEEKKILWQELNGLYARLAQIAPLWAKSLTAERENSLLAQPPNWPLAWKFQQAKAWLKRHSEGNRLEEITQRFYQRKEKDKSLIREVCAQSAWYWQLKRVTAEEKRALDFLLSKTDLQYTDNFADEQAYEFLREADFWRLSLPAWIMPVDLLLETAGPFDRMFDVVIVADSEKCDIFSSCLLLRGKKTLIIGDNMLMGGSQFTQGRAAANLLLEKSLLGLPGKIKFDLNDSLYSFALRLMEGQNFLLSERSLSPSGINEFINKNFYSEKLKLVPKAAENRLFEQDISQIAVETKKLTGYSNEEEATEIVKKLDELLGLPEYNEKTFAVITLGGIEQQEFLEQQVFERIPEEKIAKRKIICSSMDAYLGGARDIILLSLVSAKTAELADLKKLNSILNLALEQFLIFVPFTAEDLPQYSITSSLLDWTERQQEARDDQYIGGEENLPAIIADVSKELADKGHCVEADYVAGNLTLHLDIVVKIGLQKVAVILDGIRNKRELDEMLLEEETLKRQGWHFWHLRACTFYMDKEKSLQELYKFLEKLQ